ncbi:hypothetical protein [Liquorilactobacillus satsumensis]|uniref:Uncharacterized protein n=1 Tax=Liquorilactobacillus satsumensis DSM 16230 = JCM 12392 TaxID=1423801 RepID=A0A0R1V2G8_9LACO|nr:hypothetical protein [Liquorilactobacillus satsumensis]KRL99760.1 hypothetical protein FD50_GL000080 [Liquorilactobacillus satsumensis DSM 16230 = JCM 12392]
MMIENKNILLVMVKLHDSGKTMDTMEQDIGATFNRINDVRTQINELIDIREENILTTEQKIRLSNLLAQDKKLNDELEKLKLNFRNEHTVYDLISQELQATLRSENFKDSWEPDAENLTVAQRATLGNMLKKAGLV